MVMTSSSERVPETLLDLFFSASGTEIRDSIQDSKKKHEEREWVAM
jgi:hypothetical protein